LLGAKTTLVHGFHDIDLAQRPSVGGKGANLGEMTRAALPVPPGFVAATACYQMFLSSLSAAARLDAIERIDADDLNALNAAAAEMRAAIEAAPIPAAVEQAILGAFRAMQHGDEHPVAVRSSATGEDSEEASFAGLQDTYLWVRGADAVIDHVRKCWSSLYNVEALAYRRRMAMAERGIAMAVVVQRMVDARAAGVMFTRSPTSGDRSVIVIEGSFGLGSCIVSGEVTPDRFVVNKVSEDICDRAISAKTVEHVPRSAGGVEVRAIEGERQAVPCVTDDEVAALARMAKRIERHYGRPQDIEWAIDRHGALFLLQSRPETYWSRQDETPVAKPAANPMQHVFAAFGGNRA
jgi:pyruvate,water dikinase